MYEIGQKLHHDKYGTGVVVEVTSSDVRLDFGKFEIIFPIDSSELRVG